LAALLLGALNPARRLIWDEGEADAPGAVCAHAAPVVPAKHARQVMQSAAGGTARVVQTSEAVFINDSFSDLPSRRVIFRDLVC
jgi:hypothetical protein